MRFEFERQRKLFIEKDISELLRKFNLEKSQLEDQNKAQRNELNHIKL